MLPADARLFGLIPAAGHGARMGAPLPKQYLSLHGRTLAEHTVSRLLACSRLDSLVVAIADSDHWWPALPVSRQRRVITATGGDTRADSVLRGLNALPDARDSDWVLVHDMARPCVRLSDIDKLLRETGEQGAILALPVTDTIKQADDHSRIQATLPRSQVWRALTPQLFPVGPLRLALTQAHERGIEITDEASAMEAQGWHPALVTGSADNIKVTWPSDLPLAGFYLRAQQEEAERWQASV
ncbi:2-C-methyl-D-erythritol 4-phosphate cytidylyltransferase [Isoalcanivorax pacificus W11-5]|uniref:2-C-methyl-D-erythritol 4-phosphate cytidylyltransferase n=1 Tax=Isoalcanivorax pacificus W11-5 TaxID=391936 RepID=A0A0B4XQU2_9GAMM|nr:2-C-methyl-D-erythritol 4-phosphate cytidylyltransferase [Isoalcanivorax pacificus]AJD48808.1 2-C-methyl-D-erythritol 4-phosphate cytidylyltransferase [Isoalcanivorax pacificus W11-5]